VEPQSKEPGIYTLILRLDRGREIEVGSLGALSLARGYYCYTGSAQGPGGLGRVDRHLQVLRGIKTVKRWHIDYLLEHARIVSAFALSGAPKEGECELARHLAQKEGAEILVKGFGSSDCACDSHLVYFASVEPEAVIEDVSMISCMFSSAYPREFRR